MSLLIGVAHATKHPLQLAGEPNLDPVFLLAGPALALVLGAFGAGLGRRPLVLIAAALGILGAALTHPEGVFAALHVLASALVGGWLGAAWRQRRVGSAMAALAVVGVALGALQSVLGVAALALAWPVVGIVGAVMLARTWQSPRLPEDRAPPPD